MNGFDDEKGRLGRDVRMKERESGVGIIGWLSGAKDGCMETGVEMRTTLLHDTFGINGSCGSGWSDIAAYHDSSAGVHNQLRLRKYSALHIKHTYSAIFLSFMLLSPRVERL